MMNSEFVTVMLVVVVLLPGVDTGAFTDAANVSAMHCCHVLSLSLSWSWSWWS